MFNELSCKEKVVLAHQRSSLLPCFCITFLFTAISQLLFAELGLFPPELESPGGVNSSSGERYIICRDLHVREESVNTHSKSISVRQQLFALYLSCFYPFFNAQNESYP